MKPLIAIATISIALSASASFSSERGELLYENHCQSCHDKSVHTRENRLVESPEQLRAWVISWAVHNEFNWSKEEITDISAYLNRTFYRFTE